MKVVGLMSLGKGGKITLSSLTEMVFSQLGKFLFFKLKCMKRFSSVYFYFIQNISHF